MGKMITRFNNYVCESLITHQNWKSEIDSKFGLDLGHLSDILIDLEDIDTDTITVSPKILNSSFSSPNNRGDIEDKSKSWYPGFSILLSTKTLDISRFTNRLRVLADIVDRLDSEFRIKVDSNAFSRLSTSIVGYRNIKIDRNSLKFQQPKRKSDKIISLDIISNKILHHTGGDKSPFNTIVRDDRVYVSRNSRSAKMETLKLRSIIRNILRRELESNKITISDYHHNMWIIRLT